MRLVPARAARRTAQFAVVDPHVDLVDEYVALAEAQGAPIVAVLRDARAGRPRLGPARRSSRAPARRAYLPEGAGVEFDHHALADGEVVRARQHRDRRRSRRPATRSPTTPTSSPTTRRADEPWLVLTGDALLVGDAGRPDLHAHGEQTVEEMARTLYRSLTERLLALPDHLVALPGALLRARSADAACRPTRSRRSASSAATTARCSSTPRTRSSTR